MIVKSSIKNTIKAALCCLIFSASQHGIAAISENLNSNSSQCLNWSDFSTIGITEINNNGTVSSNEFQLVGNLIYRSLLTTEEYQWIGFELYGSQTFLDDQSSADIIYSIPFAAKLSTQNRAVIDFAFAADLKPSDQNKLMSIYDALHISQPEPESNPKDYLIQNEDDLGTYETHYLVNDNEIEKSRLRYLEATLDSGSSLSQIESVVINEDSTNFKQDQCWHTSANGFSNMDVVTKGNLLSLNVQQYIDLSRRQDPIPLNSRLLNLPNNPENWKVISAEIIYPKAEKIPETDSDAFLQRLAAFDLENMSTEEILQYFYDNEEHIPFLKNNLLNNEYEDEFTQRLFLMIGKNDSPNSHLLLTEIYVDENFDDAARFRSLMALKYSNNPISKDLIEQIFLYSSQDLSGNNADLSHSAMMVLGIVAQNQLDGDFGHYLSDRIATELRGSNNPAQSAALLTAIGNTGDVEQQYLVENYLNSDEPRLREKSAAALAKMPNDRALNNLSSSLSRETNSKVQTAMLKGMGSNELSSNQLNQVYSFAQTSNETQVRKAAIQALTNQLDATPEVETELRNLLKTEKSRDNMSEILDALYNK